MNNCPLCSSSDFVVKLPIIKNVNYVYCQSCGVIYHHQLVKNEIKELYIQHYRNNLHKYTNIKYKVNLKRSDLILKNISFKNNIQSSILDIGSNDGSLMYIFKQKGFVVYGMEPTLQMVEFSKQNYGVDTKHGFFDKNSFKREFDLITISHVLEHVPSPVNFIKQAKSKLHKDGFIVIEVPLISANALTIEHVTIFTKNTLMLLMSKCELSPFFVDFVNFDNQTPSIFCIAKHGKNKFKYEKDSLKYVQNLFRKAKVQHLLFKIKFFLWKIFIK